MGKPRSRLQGELAASATLAVGYVRRSTDRQEQSIGDQRHVIEQYAEEHGLTLVRFYTDDAISGTSTAKRLGFQQMMADAKARAPGFRYVVCYDLKRFGRVDNDEAGYYRHLLKQAGVEVLYASEGFTGDSTDDLLRPVKQWQARQESKDLAKVTIRGLVSKATSGGTITNGSGGAKNGRRVDAGWWMGGAPPYGYDLRYESQSGEFLFVLRYMRDGSKQMLDHKGKLIRTLARVDRVSVSKRDRARLVKSEKNRVETVQLIFELYSEESLGFKAITNRLNTLGLPTPRGSEWASHYSDAWTLGTVRAFLTNPVYSGDMVWNRRTDGRFYRINGEGRAIERKILGSPRRLEPNDERDWLVVENAHEPIISKRAWALTRERFKARAESRKQRKAEEKRRESMPRHNGPSAKYLLSGLCRCSLCNCRYEGSRNWSTKGNRSDAALIYVCGGYIRSGRSVCSRGVIRCGLLEQRVIEVVIEHYRQYTGPKGHVLLTETMTELLGGEAEESANKRWTTERKIAQIDTTIRGLLDNISDANRELVDQRLTELRAQREKIAIEIRQIDARSVGEEEIAHLLRETVSFVDQLEKVLLDTEPDKRHERKSALRRCIASIVIERTRREAQINLRRVPVVMGGPQIESTETVTVQLPELKDRLKPGLSARAEGDGKSTRE